MFTRLLVPTDFSASANAALAVARAHFPGAARCLLHVIDPQTIASSLWSPTQAGKVRQTHEQEALSQLHSLAQAGEVCVVRVGGAAEAILEQAQTWQPDLIVIGTHARSGLVHFLNGSVAEEVVRQAQRPLLLVHEHDDELMPG